MKKLLFILALSALMFTLTACSATEKNTPSEEMSETSEIENLPEESVEDDTQSTNFPFDRPIIMDTNVFLGTASNVTETSFTLTRAEGANFRIKNLKIITSPENESSKVKDGDYVEVYYSDDVVEDGAEVSPIQTNILGETSLILVNGTIEEVDVRETDTTILIKSLDSDQTYLFYVHPETQNYFTTSWEELKNMKGAKVHIMHTGRLTRSIPPQGQLVTIQAYYDTEENETSVEA